MLLLSFGRAHALFVDSNAELFFQKTRVRSRHIPASGRIAQRVFSADSFLAKAVFLSELDF